MGLNNKKPGTIYEVQVQGELDQSWEAFFNGITIASTHTEKLPITTLIVPVVDQPALRGLLCKLWDLNLALISVRQLEPGGEKEDGNDNDLHII
jgi:hypothetical protein